MVLQQLDVVGLGVFDWRVVQAAIGKTLVGWGVGRGGGYVVEAGHGETMMEMEVLGFGVEVLGGSTRPEMEALGLRWKSQN